MKPSTFVHMTFFMLRQKSLLLIELNLPNLEILCLQAFAIYQ